MAAIVTDDFNRTNAANLGANWTDPSGNGFDVSSNAAIASVGGGFNQSVYTGAAWTGGNDQYAQAKIQVLSAAADGGPLARSSSAALTGYAYVVNDDDFTALGGSIHSALYKIVAGSFTQLGSAVTEVVSAGDVIYTGAQGTTITGYRNGVSKVSQTDAAISSGNPGLYGYNTSSTWDDFEAGDFASGISVSQSASRWRNDDGTEATATWKAAQDVAVSLTPASAARLRVQTDTSGSPALTAVQLEYRKVGDVTWRKVPNA